MNSHETIALTRESDEAAREPLEIRVGLHPFLCGLSRHHIKLLADCAMATTFERNEWLFRQGDFANRFYLIETGKVSLESQAPDGHGVSIDEVGPGKMVGWSWLFPPYIWQFDARALKRTTALFFYGTILREYCEKDPSLGFELFKRLSEVMVSRLQSARAKLLECYESAPAGGRRVTRGKNLL